MITKSLEIVEVNYVMPLICPTICHVYNSAEFDLIADYKVRLIDVM